MITQWEDTILVMMSRQRNCDFLVWESIGHGVFALGRTSIAEVDYLSIVIINKLLTKCLAETAQRL